MAVIGVLVAIVVVIWDELGLVAGVIAFAVYLLVLFLLGRSDIVTSRASRQRR
jgi:hypothetical protein